MEAKKSSGKHAGYAGLKTVVELQKKVAKTAEITLVEQNDYHYEATSLHEVAAGNVAPEHPFIPGIGIRMDDFQAAIFAFVLNYAAYFCEIFRAGIQAIPKGQYEAARTLGMNYVQTMRRIILPQVFRIILPPVSNETITLVKDTSLIYVLAMNDLLRTTRNLVQRDFSITPFLVAGVFYLLMTLVLTYGFDKLEKRFSKYD